jgi:hypothetical protein
MKLRLFALGTACVLSFVATPVKAEPSVNLHFDTSGVLRWDNTSSATRSSVGHRPSRESTYQGYGKVLPMQARHAGVGPRPRRWCGWWMRTQRGGGPEFNLAWNWRKYGRSTTPQVGAVVVWRHHVGEIVGQTPSGMWIVRSGNDGGRVRERARSVAGAVFRI